MGWLALLLGLLISINGLNVVNSYVGRYFMTAISERHPQRYTRYALLYLLVFAGSTVVAVFNRFSEERLRLLWREWLTRHLDQRLSLGPHLLSAQGSGGDRQPRPADHRRREGVHPDDALLLHPVAQFHDHFAGIPRRPLVDHAAAGPGRRRLRGGRHDGNDPPGSSSGTSKQSSTQEGGRPPLRPDPGPRGRRDRSPRWGSRRRSSPGSAPVWRRWFRTPGRSSP